ncbi:DNA/RNA non-specific endonuclease [Enterococcus hirae]|uniref:DNA/RNA non-specific endonuclease n=1 Tax=Enterococcus TaxID=1350 RepID=UPI001C28569E|nr:DNA/RNA non-specific endonuclease [Enterococcus hirae]MEB7440993.1 DNA/RNA non-specific endonuclease [Enterococcus hirae]HBG9712589.1 DNA/RNA non-specific endonuclease [Enterococcus faecium]
MIKKLFVYFLSFLSFCLLSGCQLNDNVTTQLFKLTTKDDFSEIGNKNYQDEIIRQNRPDFSSEDLSLKNGTWQNFSNLDSLNRVGEANAMLNRSMMPTNEREPLYINPSGWKQKRMANGEWLYNRCHLIGFQLTGENNNPRNLMTGTRSFNTPGMVEYENQIAKYLRKTGNHVRYRVTPDFRGNELVARGIQLEAQSIEDNQLSFNVYIKNQQEGYKIDYLTGKSISK